MVSIAERLPYTRASYSARLSKDSESEIYPSPLQSNESSSLSTLISVSVSGFIVQMLSSKSHSVNQYSYPSLIPSLSVSSELGSVIPSKARRSGLAGPPFCQSSNCSSAISALPSLLNRIRYTRFTASSGSRDSASSHNLGASGGERPPFCGFLFVRFNSTKSVMPSRSES